MDTSTLVAALPGAAVLALVSVGYAVAYSSMNLVNFAHGEVFMTGALAGYLFLDRYATAFPGPRTALLAAMLVGGVAGLACASVLERWVYRPLLRRPRLTLLMVALGASQALQQLARLVLRTTGTGSSERRYPLEGMDARRWLGLTWPDLSALALLVVGATLIAWVTHRTEFGLRMRAVAHSIPALGRLKVPVRGVVARGFALGGLLAGMAGVAFAAGHTVTPDMGFEPGIQAFLACVLGGRSVAGSLVGSVVIGLLDGVAAGWMGATERSLLLHSALIVALVARPDGLLAATPERTI